MAERDHTSAVPIPQNGRQERLLTAFLYPEAQSKIPWIRLHGLGLQQGFTLQPRIRIMNDCLVITTE